MNQEQNKLERRQSRGGKIFRAVSNGQTAIFVLVFIFAFIRIILIHRGSAYGIGALVFFIFFLPSLLLLIPDILLIIYSHKLSKMGRFFGYTFHTAALCWSIFLLKIAFEN